MNKPRSAGSILNTASQTISSRADERDQPSGERSMARTVEVFNRLTDSQLTERDGWIFMVCLKLARAHQGAFKMDDYVDGAAYIALAAECEDRMYCDDEV